MAYNKCIFSGAIKTKLKPKSARKTVYAQFPLDSASLTASDGMKTMLISQKYTDTVN